MQLASTATVTRPGAPHQARGFTLIELMIGILVGTIVIAGTIALYITVIQGATYTTQEARLTQETRIAMDFMANDIRRAGYSHPARIEEREDAPPLNPFMGQGDDDLNLAIHDFDGATITGTNNCILVSYDPTFRYDPNATTPEHDLSDLAGEQYVFGYRLDPDAGTIEMLIDPTVGATDDCGAGTWAALTDPQTTQVTTLEFDASPSSCLRVPEEDDAEHLGPDAAPCSLASATEDGDIFAESRRIRVVLSANHRNDAGTQINHEETVSVRNLRIFD